MSLVPALTNIQSGMADTPTNDMSNWNAIRNIVNGDLGNVNFGSSDPLAISKTALGTYTNYATWTPSYGAQGGGSWGTITTGLAEWNQIGKEVSLNIQALGTVAGSVSVLTFTSPVAPATATANVIGGGALAFANGSPLGATVVYNGSVFTVSIFDNRVYGATANCGFSVNLSFKVA